MSELEQVRVPGKLGPAYSGYRIPDIGITYAYMYGNRFEGREPSQDSGNGLGTLINDGPRILRTNILRVRERVTWQLV